VAVAEYDDPASKVL
jgi:hypothetical protein